MRNNTIENWEQKKDHLKRETQQAVANIIRGLRSVFIKRPVIKHNETLSSNKETVLQAICQF
ncbi:MAG TPA: hypothetical protein VH396_00045 [Chitinophagaceae bacterium]|jgi:hypothetical protein